MSIRLGTDLVSGIPDVAGKADTSLGNINNTAKIAIAHNAMPSSIYKDITWGASGTTYTMQADGYIAINFANNNNSSPWSSIALNGTYIIQRSNMLQYDYTCAFFAVKKGDVIKIEWGGTPSFNLFRFYYAVGSESEA